MDGIDGELARAQEERRRLEEALADVAFDRGLYGGGGGDGRFAGYDTSIPASENDGDAPDPNPAARRLASYTGHADVPHSADDGSGDGAKSRRIIDRESDYRRRRLDRALSPDRHDAFAAGEATPAPSVRTYGDAMREASAQQERERTLREVARKKKDGEEKKPTAAAPLPPPAKRRNRWDHRSQEGHAAAAAAAAGSKKKPKAASDWDAPDAAGGITPGAGAGATPSGSWDATPKLPGGLATPTPKKQRSRWDETPAGMGNATPGGTGTTETPFGAENLATPHLATLLLAR